MDDDEGNKTTDRKLPSYICTIYHHISTYYMGQDLISLSRQRHREQIIYYRKVCTMMGVLWLGTLLLGLGAGLRPCSAELQSASKQHVTRDTSLNPIQVGHGHDVSNSSSSNSSKIVWQPANWDWEAKRQLSGPKESWKGLYVNITENKHAAAVLTADNAHFRVGNGNETRHAVTTDLAVINDPERVIPALAWFAGMSWATAVEVAGVGLGIWGAISAVQSCVTDDGSAWGNFNCIGGILSTVIGVGAAAKATFVGIKGLGWFARSSATWLESGLEAIELGVFSKREDVDPEVYQRFHERIVGYTLNQTFGSSELIGYTSENHRLGARHDEHLHPRAPIFRVQHPRHGQMDIAAREHKRGTRWTITYANGLDDKRDRLGRRQTFQHEALQGSVLEVMFDTAAAEADSCNPTFDAAAAFDQLDKEFHCFTGGNWPDQTILKVQLYDSSCQQTFGFAHAAIFPNGDGDDALQNLQPAGMPLPEVQQC